MLIHLNSDLGNKLSILYARTQLYNTFNLNPLRKDKIKIKKIIRLKFKNVYFNEKQEFNESSILRNELQIRPFCKMHRF